MSRTSTAQRAASEGKPFRGESGYGTRWTGAAETGGARARRQNNPAGTFIEPSLKSGYLKRPDGSFMRIEITPPNAVDHNNSRRRRYWNRKA